MTTPHKCPVCLGTGNVPNGFYSGCGGMWVSYSSTFDPCRSCCETGIVWGNDD